MIRPAVLEDVPMIVNIHLQSFPSFFLTFLGTTFLNELYIASLTDISGIGFVFVCENTTRGFVTATVQPSGFYRRLLFQRWWQFGWAAFPTFIRNPKIFPRLLRAFSKPHQEQPAENCGELMSIAVHPGCQEQGVGKQLVQAILEESRQRGLDNITLTTDAENNDFVNKFYLKLGFNKYRTYVTPEKRVMNEYIIHL